MTQHTPYPSHSRGAYSKVFSAGFGGAFLALTGAVGYDLSGRQAPTNGGRWADGPVWGQLAHADLALADGDLLDPPNPSIGATLRVFHADDEASGAGYDLWNASDTERRHTR